MAIDLRPVTIPDVREHPGWIWVPGAEHVRSFLSVPIIARQKMIGALMADSVRLDSFGEADVHTAEALAQHIAVAVENARLFEETRRHAEQLAILNRIASARFGWQPRFFNPRLERWLHRINVPTQIIWGDGDRIIPPAYAEALHRAIPGSTLTMIPNAGHLPHVERTPAVEQAMQAFLRH
jgi:pimeloyl-ACP methyl ester carboxylesterase